MATRFPGFPKETRKFLRQLKANNDREWFQERKQVFDEKVKAPMSEAVAALNEAFQEFAPEFVTEPKKVIYRIYRDTRFSKDKTPYKTWIAASFTARGVEKHAGAGMYFHLDPEEILVAGGVWAPTSQNLLAIRKHLAEHADEFRGILGERTVRRLFGELEGQRLKRAPKGFAADDPAVDLLVHKQFLLVSRPPAEIAETPKLQRELVKRFRAMVPFLRFLNRPLQPKRQAAGIGRGRERSSP